LFFHGLDATSALHALDLQGKNLLVRFQPHDFGLRHVDILP